MIFGSPRYVIDSSAVIDLYRRRYPRSIFGALWRDIDSLVSARELITVKSVVGEIEIQPTSARTSERSDSERINEGMFEWVRRDVSKAEELDPHLAVEVEVAGLRIASTHREWVTDDSIADPYVIAAAKLIGCTVVSSEIRSHTPDQLASHMQFDRIYPRKTKIPSVCDINGVDHLSLVEFFETEGWNY